MAFIHSFKNQSLLFPPSIEELIPEDHVCFLVESLVESLGFSDLCIVPKRVRCEIIMKLYNTHWREINDAMRET